MFVILIMEVEIVVGRFIYKIDFNVYFFFFVVFGL